MAEWYQVKEFFETVSPVTVDDIIAKKRFFMKREADREKPFTLALDLDETLIHTVDSNQSYDAVVQATDGDTKILVNLS